MASTPGLAQGPWTIEVDSPGVYSVSYEDLLEASEGASEGAIRPVESRTLVLSHLEREQPLWLSDGGDDTFGPGDRATFAVTRSQLRGPDRHPATSLHPLVLSVVAAPRSEVRALSSLPTPTAQDISNAEPAAVQRIWHFEEDRVRAPLTGPDYYVPTMWFWTVLSQRESSAFEMPLGDILTSESPGRRSPTLEISISLLGWSDPKGDLGVPQHQVDILVDDSKVGEGQWNGRTLHEVKVSVPAATVGPDSRLRLKVPKRQRAGAFDGDEPIIDIVYLDTIEVLQPIDQPRNDSERPLRITPANQWRWLPAGESSESVLATESGLATTHNGRLWLGPADTESEVWIADPGDTRRPVEIKAASLELPRPTGANYLIVAPTSLIDGARRLARIHRQRGFEVSVVDASTIYDSLGHGYESPSALRAFLLEQLGEGSQLEYVLLLGDTDWFTPDDAEQREAGTDQHRLVSPTYLSRFGPAASDHMLVADSSEITRPLTAIGRLPVANGTELSAAIDKIERFLASRQPNSKTPILLLSDATAPSLGRHRRLTAGLEESGHVLDLPLDRLDIEDSSATVVAAINRDPAVVFFAGHGSRHAWQLGSSEALDETFFFDRDDLDELTPNERPPFFVSISCATAPFDHPSASSLGELSTLLPGGGAITFVGASVRLYTPPRFGQTILDDLRSGRSIGEALMQAKRLVRSQRVSLAYNLIGDPSLGLYSSRDRR